MIHHIISVTFSHAEALPSSSSTKIPSICPHHIASIPALIILSDSESEISLLTTSSGSLVKIVSVHGQNSSAITLGIRQRDNKHQINRFIV